MVAVYNEWTAGTFAQGARVRFNGILYEAINARTASDTNNPQIDMDNWRVVAVLRIQDYNSLQEAIKLEINTDDDMINESIPMFIQLAEESFQTRIRAPLQRSRMLLTVDAESRVEVPEDLLQVINLRINDDSTASDTLFSRGATEILAGNYEEFQDLKRFYASNIGFGIPRSYPTFYEAPVYWFDDRYFHIAPTMAQGTELELYYYAIIPQLGTTVNLVNQDGQPINDAGQTVDQWVAAGNTVNSFVQATDVVRVNWYVTAAPQMLLYGAIMKATAYLKDDPRLPIWQEAFATAESETHTIIDRFQEGRHHTQQMYNAYSI